MTPIAAYGMHQPARFKDAPPVTPHDCQDPIADAEALGIRFSEAQAGYLNHHIRNALTALAWSDDREKAVRHVTARLLALCDAAKERTR